MPLTAPPLPLDGDIAAADPATLEKIKAQAYRNELASLQAHRADQLAASIAHNETCAANQQAALAWQKEQYNLLPPELTLRQRVMLQIAEKYMTTSTSVDPALVLGDAVKDAARLRAAVDEALKVA